MSDQSCVSLLHDGALVVCADDRLLPTVQSWLPLHAVSADADPARGERARIDVHVAAKTAGAPGARQDMVDDPAPLLLFAGVRAFALDDDTIVLRGASDVKGEIALDARRARIAVPSTREG